MKLSSVFVAAASASLEAKLQTAVEVGIKSTWGDGFKLYAQLVMDDQASCSTLSACVDAVGKYFDKIVQDDKTNTYVTIAWCGNMSGNKPDAYGNVIWYDSWDNGQNDKPYYVVDSLGGTTVPCGSKGMIIRGIEVDNSIAIQASPDYIHTKWDISHDQPMFDYTPSINCCDAPRCCGPTCTIDNTDYCKLGNPCGKADQLEDMWRTDVTAQLRGNIPHMVLTMCQDVKDGWKDDDQKDPNFIVDVTGLVASALFEPLDYGNNIYDHIEWDKAPKGSPLGDGEGWGNFKFSQCCSTLVIAPQV